MKILSRGKNHRIKLRGKCQSCGARVECVKAEAHILIDRDSPQGAYHVTCPMCSNEYLWVK